MPRGKGRKPARARAGPRHAPESAEERAESLLLRLETDGPKPLNAAEELDRLQAALERDERLEEVRERVADLCDARAGIPLRGEAGEVWLTLVGGFGLREHAGRVGELAADPGLTPALRIRACRTLPQLAGPGAADALACILRSRTDARVRAAAAEALAQLGDRSVRPQLEPLLEEELPLPVWQAVSEAVDRLR